VFEVWLGPGMGCALVSVAGCHVVGPGVYCCAALFLGGLRAPFRSWLTLCLCGVEARREARYDTTNVVFVLGRAVDVY